MNQNQNNIINHISVIDQAYTMVPSRGTISTDAESGPLSNIINSWINEQSATNRLEFIKTTLSRLGKPFDMSQVALNSQTYQNSPPLFKTVLDDILNTTLNYKNPDNIDAIIRASMDAMLMSNKEGVNYHNNESSGNPAVDLYNLVKSTESIVMSVNNRINNKAESDAIINLLMNIKNTGDEVSYSLVLKMLNKLETLNNLTRVMIKELSIIDQLPSVATGVNNANTSVVFNSSLNGSITNKTMGEIVNLTETALLNDIASNLDQGNSIFTSTNNVIMSIKDIIPIDALNAFNSLYNPVNENWIQSIFVQNQEYAKILNYSVGMVKHILINVQSNKIPKYVNKLIAYKFLTTVLSDIISKSNYNETIANQLISFIECVHYIIFSSITVNTSNILENVRLENITLTDAVALDITIGAPVFTAIFFNKNVILQTAANLLFRVNAYTGKSLISVDSIMKADKGSSYNPNNASGITYTQVRTFLETIPELKPFINPNQQNQQFDDLTAAIFNALPMLEV